MGIDANSNAENEIRTKTISGNMALTLLADKSANKVKAEVEEEFEKLRMDLEIALEQLKKE